MKRYDGWILSLLIVIGVSCIKLENPQVIDCTKPSPTPIPQFNPQQKENTPARIESNYLKQNLESCEEEIKRLKWESQLFQDQRDQYLDELRKCSKNPQVEMPLDEETV